MFYIQEFKKYRRFRKYINYKLCVIMILQDFAQCVYIYVYIILSTFVLINYYYFLSLFSS